MLGALIGAGSSLLGGAMNNMFAKDAAEESYENAKNMVQHHISWVVKDAKRNGIHPLAALGVNPASGPPPASVFDSGIGAAGQAIGDAVERQMDPREQMAVQASRLALEKAGLDNDFMKSQIASQRMRNIQQSTPGVQSTTGNDVLVNPFTNEKWSMFDPNAGQKAENAYSDIGGNAAGLLYGMNDIIRNLGGNPKEFYKDPVGYSSQAVMKALGSGLWDSINRDIPIDRWASENVNDASLYNWGY